MKSIFDQTTFSGINLKNRVIRSATYDKLADEHGHMTKELFGVYKKLAQGGVGTIITGERLLHIYFHIRWASTRIHLLTNIKN